ncbi:MAG: hypothetical protein SFY67_17120 [Candidatus Melainabacteria bacterium]|nr:hypothetical protein [Candidatus Melainabacteria bacterium]
MTSEKFIREAEFALARNLSGMAGKSYVEALKLARSEGDISMQGEALRGLALVNNSKRDYQKVAKCASEAVLCDEEYWGPQSTQLSLSAYLAGLGCSYIGEYARAFPYLEQALEIRQLYYPDNHPEVVQVYTAMLGIRVFELNRAEVVRLNQVVMPAYKELDPDRNWLVFTDLRARLDIAWEQGQLEVVDKVLSMLIDIFEREFVTFSQEHNSLVQLYKARLSQTNRSMESWRFAQAHQSDSPLLKKTQIGSPAAQEVSIGDQIKNKMQGARVRDELPKFLDLLIMYLQAGTPWLHAINEIVMHNAGACPLLCKELSVALEAVREHNTPLYKSLSEIGTRLQINELNELAATLHAATRTGGSIGFALMNQAQALRDSIKSRDAAISNAIKPFRWF